MSQLYQPIYKHVRCTNGNCGYTLSVTPLQLALTASKLFCKPCNAVTQFAEAQIQRPSISPEARNDWVIVRDLAVGIGVGRSYPQNLSVGQLLKVSFASYFYAKFPKSPTQV